MPRIKELAGFKEGRLGYCVDSDGVVHGYPVDDLQTYMLSNANATPQSIGRILEEEGFSIANCQVRVHCFSKEPLRLAFCVADADVEVPDNWWEI